MNVTNTSIQEEFHITDVTGVVLVEEVSVLEEFNSVDNLKAALLDNTSMNNGFKTGLVTALVKKFEWKLHTINFLLHSELISYILMLP